MAAEYRSFIPKAEIFAQSYGLLVKPTERKGYGLFTERESSW